jgi:hypothetical protein
MFSRISATILIFAFIYSGILPVCAEQEDTVSHDIKLSTELLNLLRAEMLEVTAGVQGIALYLASADWKSIVATSVKIRDSYIMEKKLTPAQAQELDQALPMEFKLLDAEFHQRAEKLGAAAETHDPELVTFHYYRLIESCSRCHSAYARSRFPGFTPAVQQDHHH